MGIFAKVEEVSPHLFSVDGDKGRVEFSKVTGKWHYYVFDKGRFVPQGQAASREEAVKAVKKVI